MIELNIKQIRRRRRMTQRELANKVGISQSYLSLIENGVYTNKKPTLNLIEDVAQALEVCPISLIGYNCDRCNINKEKARCESFFLDDKL